MAKKDLIKEKDIPKVLQDVAERFFDIPFENSAFQNQFFIEAAQITPARAYRALGLRLRAKIKAVKHARNESDLRQVDRDEFEDKLTDPDVNEFDKRRARIEIRKIDEEELEQQKLINDALVDITTTYQLLQKYPKYTREQFENEERQHFHLIAEQRKAAGNDGDNLMLMNIKTSPEILDEILMLYADNPAKLIDFEED